jgi:transposase
MLHRTRELLVRQRAMLINALRGHCAEFVSSPHRAGAGPRKLIALVEDPADDRLPSIARQALQCLSSQVQSIQIQIAAMPGPC